MVDQAESWHAKAQCDRNGFGLLRYVLITLVSPTIKCGFLKITKYSNSAIS
jgi:hypothetical protein